MSSIECILADLHISLGIISAVSSPGNEPNNATSSTRFLVTVPFFFSDDVIIFPDSFPNLVYISWLWQISHGIWANQNKREIFWKITSMRLVCFKFKYKSNSPFFTLSCLSRGIPNMKVCLSLMNPSLYLNGSPLYHLVLYRLGSKSFSVQFHRESLLST